MTRRSINLVQFWLTVAFFLAPAWAFAMAGFMQCGPRAFLAFFYREISFSRVFVAAGCGLMFLLSLAMIHVFRFVIHWLRNSRNGSLRLAIVGADDLADAVARQLMGNPLAQCEVPCFVALPLENTTNFSNVSSQNKKLETLTTEEVGATQSIPSADI